MNRDLNPREQAKLEDFVRKGLTDPGAGAKAQNPSTSLPGRAEAPLDQREVASDMKQKQRDHAKTVHPITPSVEDPERPLEMGVTGVQGDQLDVDLYARGDVSRVVHEIREQRVEDEKRTLAQQAGLPFARILGYPISPEVLAIVPRDMAKNHGIVAYLRAGKKVRLGITDPLDDETTKAIKILKDNTPYQYLVAVIGDDSYRYALKLYEAIPDARPDTDKVSVSGADKQEFERDIKSLLDLKSKIKEVPTTKLVDILLTGAVKVGASDIHIEPTAEQVTIRYRLDGVLQTVAEFPGQITNSILSRLKFLAKLKLDVNRMPQDGRFTINDEVSGQAKEIDIRVATIPVQYGEAVTMRLLDRDTGGVGVDSLGLTGLGLEQVLNAIKKPQGMVLECGPTGSGKTTTLYALLSMLNDPGKKVITLEDPIEYRMSGVLQSQVQPEHGYDFAAGFRSILRLDPDIVMVGEIRDAETAEMATQASLTGHIVLSTLHTNDAPTSIPRLIDLGVRPFLLSHAINVIMAQRLVRKVCAHCAVEKRPDEITMAEVKKRIARVPKLYQDGIPPEKEWLFLAGKGCEQCNGTGFHGRIGIFEVLIPNEAIEKMAVSQAPVSQLKQAAFDAGMMTMEQDGLIKAVTGATTVSEVWRVARDI